MPHHIPGTPDTLDIAKAQARRLSTALNTTYPLKHGQALELVSRLHGQESWGHLRALIEGAGPNSDSLQVDRSTPDFAGAEMPPKMHDISAGDHDMVLFERATSRIIYSRLHHILGCHDMVAANLHGAIMNAPGGRAVEGNGDIDMMFFPRLTLADLKMGEHLYQSKIGRFWSDPEWISNGVREAFGQSFKFDRGRAVIRGTQKDAYANHAKLIDVFHDLTGYDLKSLPAPIARHGIHAVYTGATLPPLMEALPAAVNFTGGGISQRNSESLKRVASHLMVSPPEEGFSNPADGLRMMCIQRFNISTKDQVYRRSKERLPVVLNLSHIIEACHSEVLMAIARSCGIFVIVYADRMDLPKEEVSTLLAQVDVLMDTPENPNVVQVKSRSLEESKGGILKIERPWMPLSFKDRAQNALMRLRKGS